MPGPSTSGAGVAFSHAVDVRLPDSLTPGLQASVVAGEVSLWNRQNAAASAWDRSIGYIPGSGIDMWERT